MIRTIPNYQSQDILDRLKTVDFCGYAPDGQEELLGDAIKEIEKLRSADWQPIETALKNVVMLLGYKNALGNWRTVRGRYIFAEEFNEDFEEETPEGWYEESENATDFPNVWVINPSHWKPLPKEPNEQV